MTRISGIDPAGVAPAAAAVVVAVDATDAAPAPAAVAVGDHTIFFIRY